MSFVSKVTPSVYQTFSQEAHSLVSMSLGPRGTFDLDSSCSVSVYSLHLEPHNAAGNEVGICELLCPAAE